VGAFSGGTNAKFVVILDIAISTTLISYLWIFPAAVMLHSTYGRVHQPYRVPFGRGGTWIAGGLATLWVALVSCLAVFPGTLEQLFGLSYKFRAQWGVGRATFEALTLGTLAVILVIALAGYALGRDVRQRAVGIPLEPAATAASPAS
jgi:hypothetical protein